MEIAGLLSMLPPDILPFAILALVGLYIFKGVMPYFRKPSRDDEDIDKTDAIG